MDIGILGAGTWGNALANLLAHKGFGVTVWSALPDEVAELEKTHVHPNLPGVELDSSISYTADVASAASGRDLVVFATPSQFIRSTARAAREHLDTGQICVSVAKGIEQNTFLTMSEVAASELEGLSPRMVALSGPTHAEEVARGMLSTIVSASDDAEAARVVQETFATSWMRVYTGSDPRGAEICGALKNVIALAAGIAGGLGCGDNARAALITRGLAEMKRLGTALGCEESTFYGLAGMGDLIVTCSSEHSRNNRAGKLIGSGMTAEEACKEVGMVVEGLNALPAALALAERCGVEMPIAEAVDDVVSGREAASGIIEKLYSRELKAE